MRFAPLGPKIKKSLIEIACKYDKPVRIGVNWGSLDQSLLARIMDENARRLEPWNAQAVMYEALVTRAIEKAQRAEEIGMPGDKIILSCKVSGVQDLIAVYRELARRCNYPLHLGLTEAGMGSKGIVASTAASDPADDTKYTVPSATDGEEAIGMRDLKFHFSWPVARSMA